ncbi:MAG: NYN domain-containing protein [Myxococcales bacterium]|nr:NYN domain-containing protein [Myxococcales bacterium]
MERETVESDGSQVATADDLAGYGFVGDEEEEQGESEEPPRPGTSSRATSRSLHRGNGLAEEPRIAVFVDYENLAIGARNMRKGTFKIDLILRRLLEKGRIVYKRAYCDWGKYRSAVREFHSQGVELVDIPQSKASGKNSADIHMVVDALDLCYQKQHIDSFALISGDSDFSPLAKKLKENDKFVIGCGIKSSTSDLLIGSCDEFIYYDDLARSADKPRKKTSKKTTKSTDPKMQEAADRVLEIVRSLERDYDTVWGSMVKQATRRVFPGFNEEYYGCASFADLLVALQKLGHIDLEFDEARGNYIVRSPRP